MSANGTILLLPRAPHVPGGVGGGGGAGIMGVPAPTARAGVEMITSAGSSAWGGLQARLGVAARGKKLRSVAEARGRAGTAVLALRCVKSQSQSQSLAMGAGGSNPPAAFGAGLEIGARPAGHGDEAAGEPSLVVFSGGTAFNGVAPRLKDLTTRVSHVLPVSDDGGSTAEIVRFLGGPAVGDIRSRCLRLAEAGNEEALAVRELLAHRLHPTDHIGAKAEWLAITEGEHALWDGISDPYKHTIRAFLVHFQFLVMRSSNNARFSFVNGSVGNFFFAGARTFFGSMDSAIFMFSRVSGIPPASLVLPCICTEERITLGAQLDDGTIIRGQNNISHPPPWGPEADAAEVEGPCCSIPSHLLVNKEDDGPPLSSPIRRVFYLGSLGDGASSEEHEVFPAVNPRVLQEVGGAELVVYAMGSLYTSICPSLTLQGVGEAIAARGCPKVMLLNGCLDRETMGMDAAGMARTVVRSLNRTFAHTRRGSCLEHPPAAYVTHLLAPEGGRVAVDEGELWEMGVEVVWVAGYHPPGKPDKVRFHEAALVEALGKIVRGGGSGAAI
mmetsp:Transcript_32403/g.103109  ORF Transcript_32403/g.103109 Transcript_32403/m.103109 type:complete len:556 (+) Transcript_32403:35-1702(+)